ncbi:type II toxin-antitoxin system VapC family toxin [Candidatus Micrarchaeota archaeon]|nr:type II toxin-antitoxin system VapC family toxin [Candidatus Micrarchaeota archaeon]
MVAIDTNVLIYYVLDLPDADKRIKNTAGKTRIRLKSLIAERKRLLLPMPVIVEFANFVKKKLPRETANKIIRSLFEEQNFEIASAEKEDAEIAIFKAIENGSDFNDALICAIMDRHGEKQIFTWDDDFSKFKGIEIIR